VAFCPYCGISLPESGTVCPLCGKSLAGPSHAAVFVAEPAGGALLPDRWAATLAYVTFIPAVLFLLIEPYRSRSFVRFHAWQSILFHLICAAAGVVVTMAAARMFGGVAFLLAWPLFVFAAFLTWCVLVMKAFREELFQLPFIGDLAQKQSGG